jgi:hypothetical protein
MWNPRVACSWRVGPFWGLMDLQFGLKIILLVGDAIASVIICFLVCGVWVSVSAI